MAGFIFPPETNSDRENSYDYGTPVTPAVDPIPIDPALGGPVIDPALLPEGMNGMNGNIEHVHPVHPEPPFPLPPPHFFHLPYPPNPQYNEGPQGDPFAPLPPPIFFPPEEEQPEPLKSPQKPPKRKRKSNCNFCQGNDDYNKDAQPEKMVVCTECHQKSHPSCQQLEHLSDVIRTWKWKCTECKECEICKAKGADDNLLLCDACDRGWHKDCLDPPLLEVPTGDWHCPMCSHPPAEDMDYEMKAEVATPAPETFRGSSVASSSRSERSPIKAPKKRRRKPKVSLVQESEGEEMEVDATPRMPTASVRLPPTSGKRRVRKPRKTIPQSEEEEQPEEPPSPPPKRLSFRIRVPQRSVKGKEREEEPEDHMKRMFEDMLSTEDRDTKNTSISEKDRSIFAQSEQMAINNLVAPPPTASTDITDIITGPGPSRPTRAALAQQLALQTELAPSPAPSTPAPITKNDPNNLRIRYIRFGAFDIKTWYDAPFPEEYSAIPDGRLWICEFCLKYMKNEFLAHRHGLKCRVRHPPGDEIYRDGNISIFEIDGRKNKIYCQNLCLLSKMFLDHKSLFYDVEPFLFYVMTELDDTGARFVGYFSKEKRSLKDYNLSCIMTLPVRQRRGWGNLLMDFSYLLSKKEQLPGSPEKPLSDLGAVSYKNYWTLSVMRYLQNAPDHPRLEDISAGTGMTLEDIVFTLTHQRMISTRERTPPPIKLAPGQTVRYPKGRKNGVARRHLQRTITNDPSVSETPKGPFVPPKHYEISFDRERVSEYVVAWEAKGYLHLRPEKLQWSPYVLVRKDQEQVHAKEQLMGEKVVAASPETNESTPMEGLDEAQPQEEEEVTPIEVVPLNLFDDDAVVEEAPSRRGSPTKKSRSRLDTQDTDTVMAELNGVDDLEDSSRRKGARPRPSTRSTPKRPVKPRISTNDLRSVTRSGRRTISRANTDANEAWPSGVDRPQQSRLRSRTGEAEKNGSVSPPPSPSKPGMQRKRRRVGSISDGEGQQAVTVTPSINGIGVDPNTESPVPVEEETVESAFPPPTTATTAVRDAESPATKEDEEDGEALFTGKESEDTMITSPPDTGEGKMIIEEDLGCDEDADGEYDEDAEGEPDDGEDL